MLNCSVRKIPILQIGAVPFCTGTTCVETKTSNKKQNSSDSFGFKSSSRCNSSEELLTDESSASFDRGFSSRFASLFRAASAGVLAIVGCISAFAAAPFKALPYTDPFPPAASPGGTTYCQPSSSVLLNENVNGVTLPFTRALPSGWQSGLGAVSVEFWLKQKAPSSGQAILDNPDGVIVHGPGFFVTADFMFGGGPGSIVATFSQVKGGAFLASRPVSIALEPSDQQWHQYVLTYDLRTIRMYRDGELIDTKWMDNNTDRIGPIEDDTGAILTSVMEVGGGNVTSGRRFNNGFLDSVRVSSVALNPWQVRRNFENAHSYTKTLYVAPGASGTGSQASPASLTSALGQVGANTRIILQPGTYSGGEFQVTRSASGPREHCLITGADGSSPAIISGGTPTLSGAHYVVLRNLTFSSDNGNALTINNSTGVTIDSCRISGSQKGLVASGSSKISVQNNVVNAGNIGVQLMSSPNNIVRNNTVVNGTVGLQLDSGANYASVLNNLLHGQSSASIIVNNGAQQWYRGNGNLFNPNSGTAAILNGTSYSTAQVRDKSLAQAWYNFDKADKSDNNSRRTGYSAEGQSMAFAPVFVDAANGDFRLAANLGNAQDAGAERTYQRTVTSPAYDSLGAARPQGNGVDVGAFEGSGAAYAVFNLNADFTTSAGVYKPDGTLIRTLFSNRRMAAGTNVVFWNGLDDNNQIAATDTYTIKMIAHNVQYIWENVVGNSSVPNCGESVHNGFEPMKAMAFNGTAGFYTSGYNESHYELNRFEMSNPNKLTKIFGPKTIISTDSITDIAADGSDLYGMNSSSVAVYSQGNNSLTRTINTGGGNSHVEVQRNGNLLFVSKKGQNTIAIYDKNNGGQTGSISVNAPDDLSVTASGDLWVISGTSAIRYTVNSGGGSVAQTIPGFGNPIAIACSPVDGSVLVADASTWQVKAFNSGGSAIWTHGQSGGYANGPRVTPDKFYWAFIDQGRTHVHTVLQFQPDGTWWIGDTFLSRTLHFNMSRQLLNEIIFQPHTYMASVDVNNGSRVFNRFTEYNVDYSKPPQQAWTITNFWGFGLPSYAFGFDDGLCSVITMSNGKTFALSFDGGAGGTRVLVELTSTGLRETSQRGFGNYTRIQKDGSIYGQSGNGPQTYWKKAVSSFNGNGEPQWGSQTTIATANIGNGFLSSEPLSERFPLTTASGTVVVHDPSRRNGYHLGGIKPGGNTWLWKAMPTIGGHDGHGSADSWIEYGGNYHMVAGRNIFAGFHGEFFQDAGQSGQFFHYFDNGLFVGQFGQPLLFGVVVNPPGGSGNCFAPSLVEVGNNVMLYHNDEPGRGSHRWRAEGLSDIRELTANITVGQAPTGTANTPSSGITNTIGGSGISTNSTNGGSGGTLPTISVAATTQAAEGGATGVFTFTRSGSTTGALTVNFTVGGTATAGSDYTSIGTSVSFPAGATNKTVNVVPVDDTTSEGSETVVVSITAGSGYTLGSPDNASLTITDNDTQTPLNLADLVVTALSTLPASPTQGQAVTFSATVKNQGAAATPNTSVSVGFAVDGTTVTWGTAPGGIAVGQSVTVAGSGTWTATSGTHALSANADTANSVTEVLENNNSLVTTLNVAAPNGATNPIVKLAMQSDKKMAISWNSVVGKTYQVSYKSSLTNSTWLPLGSPVTATGTTSSYIDNPLPVGVKTRFYNVKVQ